jgi:hypothetical protein
VLRCRLPGVPILTWKDEPKQIGAAQSIRVDRPGSPVDFSTSGAHYVLYYDID